MSELPFRPALEAALQASLEHLEHLDHHPVHATAGLTELRAGLWKRLNDEPVPALQVVEDLVRDTAGGHLGSAGGRFFAWAIGGALPAALAADWLTSAWDQNAALYACGPAAAVVEEIAGEWLKSVLGLPAAASFALVSGCQMAHATCLAAARHRLLQRAGWDVERHGLGGAPRLRVFASNRHGSLGRAVRLLGLGEASVIDLPLDDAERTVSEALVAGLHERQGEPAIVVLQAGDLNTGSFDSYRELIPAARRYGAWVHVDGAFGLWAAASRRHRSLVDGVAEADSWATDGHKWLNVPYDCGYAFVADAAAHRGAMAHRAPYLVHDAEARDQIDWNPEWSRRGRGFATYAALRSLGRSGLERLVDACCQHACDLVDGLASLPGVRVLWRPVLNQGLVRFVDPRPEANEENHDHHTDTVIGRVVEQGEAFFMGTTWRGRRAMRVSVLNWQTRDSDVRRAVEAVRRALL